MADYEYVYVINEMSHEFSPSDYVNVHVVTYRTRYEAPGEVKDVYIINGMDSDSRPTNYRYIKIISRVSYDDYYPNAEYVNIVNFGALRQFRSLRKIYFPEEFKEYRCPYCFHIRENSDEIRLSEWIDCPNCGFKYMKVFNEVL